MNFYLQFSIGDINLAILIDEVKEVVRPKSILQSKKLSKNLIGFFILRKQKIPLFDLPQILKLKSDNHFEVILSQFDQKDIGFKVSKVKGIVKSSEIIPYPELCKPKKYLIGIIKERDHIIQIISLKKILTPSRYRAMKRYR